MFATQLSRMGLRIAASMCGAGGVFGCGFAAGNPELALKGIMLMLAALAITFTLDGAPAIPPWVVLAWKRARKFRFR